MVTLHTRLSLSLFYMGSKAIMFNNSSYGEESLGKRLCRVQKMAGHDKKDRWQPILCCPLVCMMNGIRLAPLLHSDMPQPKVMLLYICCLQSWLTIFLGTICYHHQSFEYAIVYKYKRPLYRTPLQWVVPMWENTRTLVSHGLVYTRYLTSYSTSGVRGGYRHTFSILSICGSFTTILWALLFPSFIPFIWWYFSSRIAFCRDIQ